MSKFLYNPDSEMEQARRMMIMFGVMTLLLFGYPLFLNMTVGDQPPPSEAETSDVTDDERAAGDDGTELTDAAGEEPGVEPEPVDAVLARPDVFLAGENASFRLTNQGARLAGVRILAPEQYLPNQDMVGVFPVPEDEVLPLIVQLGGLPHLTSRSRYTLVEEASSLDRQAVDHYHEVTYRWTSPDETIIVERIYRLSEHAFALEMDVRVHNASSAELAFDGLRVGVAGSYDPDGRSGGLLDPGASVLETICHGSFGTQRRPAAKIPRGKAQTGSIRFFGVGERYFLTALAIVDEDFPTPSGTCTFERIDENHVSAQVAFDGFEIEAGGERVFSFLVYAGPKDERYLSALGAGLQKSIDLGWFAFLAAPIRFFLLLFFGFLNNWGLAIIFLTLMVKILLSPLTHKSYKSMEKMREIQPELQALQKRYENDRAKLAEEQMKLFKESGANPLSGCLPMLLQMPIYIALYRTIWGSAELFNAPFFWWITDLSSRDPIFVLPLLMGIVMFVQQKMMPQAVDNPQMRMVQRIMPIMFTGFMLFLPSGLVLYIFVNMFLSIFQQLYIRKRLKKSSDDSARGAKTT